LGGWWLVVGGWWLVVKILWPNDVRQKTKVFDLGSQGTLEGPGLRFFRKQLQ